MILRTLKNELHAWQRAGRHHHAQEVDGQDKIVELINTIIVNLLQTATERRMSSMAANRKFAKFIRDLIESEDD